MHNSIFITAVSGVEYDDAETPDFKALVKELFGKQIRRIGPFIQMVLVGATPAVRSAPLPLATNVYLTSGSGDIDVTVDVLNRTIRDKQVPKPLSFINTVSNAACYYLTKHLKIGGSTSFLSTREFALESAFLQAMMDMSTFNVDTALVGSVDILSHPNNTHRTRIGATANEPIAQGSHWFRLSNTAPQAEGDQPLGRLIDASMHHGSNGLEENLKSLQLQSCEILYGNRVVANTKETLQKNLALDEFTPQTPSKGHYGTNAGQALREYLTREELAGTQLLYIQENERGELSHILLEKF